MGMRKIASPQANLAMLYDAWPRDTVPRSNIPFSASTTFHRDSTGLALKKKSRSDTHDDALVIHNLTESENRKRWCALHVHLSQLNITKPENRKRWCASGACDKFTAIAHSGLHSGIRRDDDRDVGGGLRNTIYYNQVFHLNLSKTENRKRWCASGTCDKIAEIAHSGLYTGVRRDDNRDVGGGLRQV